MAHKRVTGRQARPGFIYVFMSRLYDVTEITGNLKSVVFTELTGAEFFDTQVAFRAWLHAASLEQLRLYRFAKSLGF